MASILEDSGLTKIDVILDLKTFYGKEVLKNLLQKAKIFPNKKELLNNQKNIEQLRNLNENDKITIQNYLDLLIQKENDCKFFFEEKNSLESLEQDTFGQLIFTQNNLKIFNHIPFLLKFISYLKIYVVPFISVFFPIIVYFIPYLLIKYVWNLPIPYEMYTKIMGHMMNFSFDSSPEKLLQTLFTIFTLAQSIYQPIQNAFHLHKINTTIYDLGKNLQEYSNLVENLENFLNKKNIVFKFTKSCLDNFEEYRRNFVEVLENPFRIHFVSKNLSLFEVLWRISKNTDFTKVTFYESSVPYFKAKSICDINLSKESRIGSSIEMYDTKHFLLSGPNGGGKSSFLRSVLQTLLFSQAFGYAYGESIELCIFDYILSGLNIQDSPGKKSLFEKEICFARDVLYYNNPEYKGFVMFDEIFHSTNPPDGIKTSNKFLNKLWSYNHVASIVSTHVFEIIESSPSFVEKICVGAKYVENKLVYDYKIQKGICKESSVEEIWNKNFDAASSE
jgi:hypothetical protein